MKLSDFDQVVTLAENENTAISLIGNSESDHAGQCYMYLKQIEQNF